MDVRETSPAVDGTADPSHMEVGGGQSELPRIVVYRCRKCREHVVSQSDAIEHSPGGGTAKGFAGKKSGGKDLRDDLKRPACSSIFVEPKKWMTSAVSEGVVEGKLFCVRCQARLGNFNWAGMQCSCGSWVNPAFQLHKSRMDASWS